MSGLRGLALVLSVALQLIVGIAVSGSSDWPVAAPRLDLTPAYKTGPSVATDGRDYLVVWSSDGVLLARRVSADGVPKDSAPSMITIGERQSPAVVWNGTEYVVAWNDTATFTIMAVRISRDGTPIEVRKIAAYPPPAPNVFTSEYITAIAATGRRILVAWWSYQQDVRATIIDNNLNVVVPGVHIRDASALLPQGNLVVSTDGHNFIVLWNVYANGTWGIDGSIVGPTGASHHVNLAAQASRLGTMRAVFDGKSWVVMHPGATPGDLHFLRIGASGEIAGESHAPQPQNAASYVLSGDAMAASPSGSIAVFWMTIDHAVLVQRLDPDLTLVSTAKFADDVGGFALSLDGALLATVRTVPNGYPGSNDIDVQTIPVWPDGTAGPSVSIGKSVSYQTRPAIDGDPQGWAAAWLEPRLSAPSRLYAGRLSTDGTLTTGKGVQISTQAVSAPSMAFNGASHLAVWRETTQFQTRVLAQRLSITGELLGPTITVDEQPYADTSSIAVASDRRDWLVVWVIAGDSGGLRAARVRADGTLDPMVLTVTSNQAANPATGLPSWNSNPAIAFADGMYWIAWTENLKFMPDCPFECPPTWQGDIYCARITADGQLLDANGGIPVARHPEDQDSVAIASNGDGAMLVWQSGPTNSFARSIRAAAVSRSGQLVDIVPSDNGRAVAAPFDFLTSVFGTRPSPSIATDGSAYAAVWASAENGTTTIHRARFDARANMIVADGILRSLAGPTTALDVLTRDSLRVVNGHWFIGYTRLGIESLYTGAPRAFIREIDNAPPRVRAVPR